MKLECLICGKNYSSLGHHLSLVHKMTKYEFIINNSEEIDILNIITGSLQSNL